jgi:ubiquinone biosynthesis protein
MDWNELVDEAAIAEVLPEAYARYRRPIKEAMARFLGGLSAEHQAGVIADQVSLAPEASVSERFARLARSCPALHKLGQTLARDRRLSPELRLHLQQLESLPPSVAAPDLRDLVERELGDLERCGVTLAPPALAEGSVAVVVPFRLRRATRAGAGEGVFKLLKPAIEERLEEELSLIESIGAYLDERCEDLDIPRLDYCEVFESLAERLRQEVRLDEEQRHLATALRMYAGDPWVHVPALFDLSSRRMTAMERLHGEKVTEHGYPGDDERRRLAGRAITALLARPMLSTSPEAIFHGDPHAGNLLLTREGRLGILDWSLATTLGEAPRRALVTLVIGALTFDRERIGDSLAALAGREALDDAALRPIVDEGLRQVRQGRLPGLLWMTSLLDTVAQTAHPRFGAELTLLRKNLHTLEGVVVDIGAERTWIDAVLLGEFIAQFTREWPLRWMVGSGQRTYGTRLSNADLAELALRLPFAATRAWLDGAEDLMRGTAGDRSKQSRTSPNAPLGNRPKADG